MRSSKNRHVHIWPIVPPIKPHLLAWMEKEDAKRRAAGLPIVTQAELLAYNDKYPDGPPPEGAEAEEETPGATPTEPS